MITASGPAGPAEPALVPGELVTYSRLLRMPSGGGRPFGPESVPSATSAALRCLLVTGPFPGLDPRPAAVPYRNPRAGLRSNLPPIAVMSTVRGQRRLTLLVRGCPVPAGSRADPGPRCLRAVRLNLSQRV